MSHATDTREGRVIAIEPDARRARALETLLARDEQLSIEVVPSISEAVAAVERGVPDVIMANALLPPAEEADLIGRLKQMPQARHVPIVDMPIVETVDIPKKGMTSRLGIFRSQPRPHRGCDGATLQAQILEYVREARAARRRVDDASDEPTVGADVTALVASNRTEPETSLAMMRGRDRRRARRRRRDEMPWLWTVKLPWGADVRVLDMSSTGIQIETAAQIEAGGRLDLKMIGEQENLVMPAQAVRTETAWVRAGALYRVGLEFTRELETFGPHPLSLAAALRPKTLTDVLSRVVGNLERGVDPAQLRASYTDELRRLLPARDIQLRPPDVPSRRDNAVQFSVPSGNDGALVLEVAFDHDYQPSLAEFRFLQAAAAAAGVVTAFSSASGERSVSASHDIG
jgi:hypothetical protein